MSCACRLGCTALLFWKERMLRADNTTVIVLALQERNGPAIPMHRDEIMVDMAQGIDHIPFPGTPYNIYEVPKVSFTTWVPLVFCVKDEPLRPWSRITWFSNAEKVTDRICLKNMICIFCLLSTIPCVLYLKNIYISVCSTVKMFKEHLTSGSSYHSFVFGANRRSVRMACLMKKMRYMEKNMRDGHAWSGSQVTAHKTVKWSARKAVS